MSDAFGTPMYYQGSGSVVVGHAPPQNPNPSAAGATGGGGGGGRSGGNVEMYDPDFQHVISLAPDKIVHTPHPSLGVSRLVLCRNFSPDSPTNSCSKGETCKFVHADTVGARRHPIHVNYAWRSLDVVTYPRLPPGETLVVFAPNERPPAEDVDSERVLLTRGSLMRKEHTGPLSHCAHYYFNRMCNRGERCNFIHAIVIDSNASDLQRAPAPTTIAPLTRLPKRQHTAAPSGGGGVVVSVPPSANNFTLQLPLPDPTPRIPGSNHLSPSTSLSVPTGGNALVLQPMNMLGGGGVGYVVNPHQQHLCAPNSGHHYPQQQQQQQPHIATNSIQPSTILVLDSSQIVPTGPQSFQPPPPGAQVFFVQQQQQQPQQATHTSLPLNQGSSNNAAYHPFPHNMVGQQQIHSMQPPILDCESQHTPSMTSLFAANRMSVVPATTIGGGHGGLTAHHQPLSPMPARHNPMEWSMIGGIHNNGSMSSMSLSNSHSGAAVTSVMTQIHPQ